MAAIRKIGIVLAAPALLGVLGATTADASPVSTDGDATVADTRDFSDCPAGFACFYTGPNGTGDKCQWSGASPQHADACSWAADTDVRSIYNHGTSAAFAGLCSYRSPNYDPNPRWVYLAQGVAVNLPPSSDHRWKILSHRWVRTAAAC